MKKHNVGTYLYHYSAVPRDELLNKALRGIKEPKHDERWKKRYGYRYVDHISTFMEPIPYESIHESFPDDHPVWYEGNTIYEHRIEIDTLDGVQFAILESTLKVILRDRAPDWVSDKVYFALQDAISKVEIQEGKGSDDMKKACLSYRGTVKKQYDKLREKSTKYAPTVPHMAIFVTKPVPVHSSRPVVIGMTNGDWTTESHSFEVAPRPNWL